MELTILTHQGLVSKEVVEFIQIVSDEHNFGILQNHIPLVTVINEGYVKFIVDKNDYYVSVCGAVFEFSNNSATVLAQEAQVGRDLEEAKQKMNEFRNKRLELNRQETADFAKKEKELYDHMRNAGASNL
jgi:F-type H+-transporting ATPase subunit epsilon